MKKIAILASGGGSNFANLVKASRAGRVHAEVVGLVVSRSPAGAIHYARDLGVPYEVLRPQAYADFAAWDHALLKRLTDWNVDWVVLAGFLLRIGPAVLNQYPKRIVNIHPSLLPKFGGVGMYGEKVHRAVIAAQESESGVTIHLVDGEYDRGPIVAQARLSVDPHESAAQLEARIKDLEIEFYPKVLNDLLLGRLTTS